MTKYDESSARERRSHGGGGASHAAWLLRHDSRRPRHGVTVGHEAGGGSSVSEGDVCLVWEHTDGRAQVTSVGRVYRIRRTVDETTVFFDAEARPEPALDFGELELDPNLGEGIHRPEWSKAQAVLDRLGVESPTELPLVQDHAYVRDLLQMAVVDDLLGPADGPFEEVVGMSVRERYLVGKLAPRDTPVPEDQLEDLAREAVADPDDPTEERDPSTSSSLAPSSLGMTFCVDSEVQAIEIEARWGAYVRTESEIHFDDSGKPKRVWRRVPRGGTATLHLRAGPVGPLAVDAEQPGVVVTGVVREPLPSGERLLTLFLVNTQQRPETNEDEAWVFQPELVARGVGGAAVFRRRPSGRLEHDPEHEALAMIYRRHVEFAVGHGVSIHAESSSEDHGRAVEVRTRVVPEYEVPFTETPGRDPRDRPAMRRMFDEGLLDMARLADMERSDLVRALEILASDYQAWITEQRARIGVDVKGYDDAAHSALERCEEVFERLREGISVLAEDDRALAAFRFANRAMALQRVHAVYARGRRRGERITLEDVDVPNNRTWRPFQLAFILLAVPSLADPRHRDRTQPLEAYADLLWFPTGGGKTEAYLGVAAFAMAVRRLQDGLGGYDSSRGLAVIMRYTLRLLTLQQFQRASTLMCAMEHLRMGALDDGDDRWGREPFTIGLWVGQRVTPNRTEESEAAVRQERGNAGRPSSAGSPAQLTSCPWCGSPIDPGRDIEVSPMNANGEGKTIIYCGDKYQRCEFSKRWAKGRGLPVLVVDDEIYRRPPSLLIATVDKFALMAWRGEIQTLFGRADAECDRHGLIWPGSEDIGTHRKYGDLPAVKRKESVQPIRPPDLIIQDEFHLISGPLGTMVGLYETAVDALCTWELDGREVHPKVVASTATARRARDQVHNVFLRRVQVFPPHGLDVDDDFFSVRRPIGERPGRRYVGICAPGSSRPATLIRVYVALLTAARALFDRFGRVADPYMTLVGYFNSLRELGGMRRLAEDDVQTRCFRVQMSDVPRPGLAQRSVSQIDELTSRVSNKEIPRKLDRLEVAYKTKWQKGETRAIDVVLATNMLSVGVDVDRLGLMVVNGQPKTTAEYIQATSRVGRAYPGLVCTVLNWARPRDLSHYEAFEHYHATFYWHVEAQSVTPFAPRALDRGLTGVLVAAMRLGSFELNPNSGAEKMDSPSRQEAKWARAILVERAWRVTDTKSVRDRSDAMIAERLDDWAHEANVSGRRLGYDRSRDGVTVPLLRRPGVEGWGRFTVPMSMREVEPGVRLVMDLARVGAGPDWPRREGGEAE